MKRLLMMLLFALPVLAKAQNYNPFVAQGIISPAPLMPVEANGTGTVSFIVGNSGSDALPLVANQEMLVVISLSRGVPDVADPTNVAQVIASISGSFAGYFNWQYDPSSRTFLGTQNQTIPGFSLDPSAPPSAGYINIPYRVTQNSISTTPQNGFNVNITPPAYSNGSNALGDDKVSSYTWTKVLISGTVFDDPNGNTVIDNGETGTTAGTSLYAYLVESSTGLIKDSVKVAPDGTYTLDGFQSTTYTVELSTQQYAIGTNTGSTPIDNTAPAGWATTGENTAGNTGSGDGTPNGTLSVTTGDQLTMFYQQNFGIEQLPNSDPKTQSIAYPAGTTIPAGTITTQVTGSDPEDGLYTSGSGHTIVITALPTNATMLYNGVAVTLNQQITDFNPALLSFTNISPGSVKVEFYYAFIDAAGKADPTPALYNINWLTPLPITLRQLSALALTCSEVRVSWKVSDAVNFNHFEVERSKNGGSFETIALVFYQDSDADYEYKDAGLDAGKYQYRLKLVDRDGQYKYSAVQYVSLDCQQQLVSVYPNPATDKILVSGLKGGEQLQLFDIKGRLLMQQKAAVYQVQIDLTRYVSGTYLLTIRNGAQTVQTQKIIKQ